MRPRADSLARRRLLGGAVQVMSADGLALPTGILVAALLARAVGPDGYGVFALGMSIVTSTEWFLTALMSRASIALVSETTDWQTVGAGVLRIHFLAGLTAGALLAAAAWPLARAFEEPRVTVCLLVLATGLPIASLATGCRSVLSARGRFTARAASGAVRWIARLAVVLLLAVVGLTVPGAAAANVAGVLAGLVVARRLVGRLPAPGTAEVWRRFWALALPTFALTLSLRLLDKIGLVALKALGGTTEEVGWYAAAQNFAIAPGFVAISLAPLLLSSINQALTAGDVATAKAMGRDSLRVVALAWPLAAILGGSSGEIIRLVYGPGFDRAAPLAGPFLMTALALAVISVTSAMLTATGHAREATRSTWPILPIALAGFVALVPRFGAMGAAVVTSVAALVGAAAALGALRRLWRVRLPLATCARSLVLSCAAWMAAAAWPTPGAWWLGKACVLSAAVIAGFAIAREFSANELAMAGAVIGVGRRNGHGR